MKYHKNKETLNDLEMAKKRDRKIMITNEAIKKVPRIKYKNIPESEYNTIQELARNVLRISKNENNSNEAAITYGMDSVERIQKGEEYIGVALGNEHGVDPISNTTAYHLVSFAKDLKGLQKAADHFLRNCYMVGIDYDNR